MFSNSIGKHSSFVIPMELSNKCQHGTIGLGNFSQCFPEKERSAIGHLATEIFADPLNELPAGERSALICGQMGKIGRHKQDFGNSDKLCQFPLFLTLIIELQNIPEVKNNRADCH